MYFWCVMRAFGTIYDQLPDKTVSRVLDLKGKTWIIPFFKLTQKDSRNNL